MSVFVKALRCRCGKLHSAAGIGLATTCACGRKLWPQVFGRGVADPADRKDNR